MQRFLSLQHICSSLFSCLLIFLFVCMSAMASTADIEVTNVFFNAKRAKPKAPVIVTYRLKAKGQMTSAFNLGIFIAKGGRGKWIKKWGLPSPLMDDLNRGKEIQQSWNIELPDWGDGRYRISVHADVDNFLNETNKKNNSLEKKLVVGKYTTEGSTKPLQTIKPLLNLTTPSSDDKRVFRKIEQKGVARAVLPDGGIELRFQNGSGKLLRPDGKIFILPKDGQPYTEKSLQVPSVDLPPLPSEADAWVEQVQGGLLQIIEEQLTKSEMDNYIVSESGKTNYDIVLWRIRFIDFIFEEQKEAGP